MPANDPLEGRCSSEKNRRTGQPIDCGGFVLENRHELIGKRWICASKTRVQRQPNALYLAACTIGFFEELLKGRVHAMQPGRVWPAV